MALIVFFRGINVGGHRAFRPSVLAKELGLYDAVNVGAAGTLVIRKPGSRAKFLAELRRKLPFEATISFCDGRDLIRLGLRPLKRFGLVAKPSASGLTVKLPRDLNSIPVHSPIPGFRFLT